MLADVSVDYYTRLDRGNLGGVSETVLEALARALELDEAERAHLYDLARAASSLSRPRRAPTRRLRPAVQRILDSMHGAPALVRIGRIDILGGNLLGRALYAESSRTRCGGPTRLVTSSSTRARGPSSRSGSGRPRTGSASSASAGLHTSCVQGGYWGAASDGGRGEAVRAPFADGTLVKLPDAVDLSDTRLATDGGRRDRRCRPARGRRRPGCARPRDPVAVPDRAPGPGPAWSGSVALGLAPTALRGVGPPRRTTRWRRGRARARRR